MYNINRTIRWDLPKKRVEDPNKVTAHDDQPH